jgi:hypothetical protein|tara:strand:+ start:256 stop:843 length:588 start_codon:yes stop_codon:yes gene_type:complete
MNKELIFKNIPDKRQYKNTTSLKFKEDLIDFFSDIGSDNTILEVGTNRGHTTRILSFLFKNVITLDWLEEPNLRLARELCNDRDNITYIQKDVYGGSWSDLNLPKYNVSFIDCGHRYNEVISDIHNCITYGADEQYLIFDDYGHPTTEVKKAIIDICNNNDDFKVIRYVGEGKGSDCRRGLLLKDWEGIICKYVK